MKESNVLGVEKLKKVSRIDENFPSTSSGDSHMTRKYYEGTLPSPIFYFQFSYLVLLCFLLVVLNAFLVNLFILCIWQVWNHLLMNLIHSFME